MATIKWDCPHCATKDIALVVCAWSHVKNGLGSSNSQINAHLWCPRCSSPSCASLQSNSVNISASQLLSGYNGDPTEASGGWQVIQFWPMGPEPRIPKHMPPNVERVYLQAEHNFPTVGQEDASGTMYRKALDIGLLQIDSDLKGMLGAKIRKLVSDGRLTKDIGEWANQVRELGNEAAHDAPAPTRQDLDNLRNFTEMVLRYLFTLPNMIKKRRGEKLPWEP